MCVSNRAKEQSSVSVTSVTWCFRLLKEAINAVRRGIMMSKHGSIEAFCLLLLFLAVIASSVDGICWNCMKNLPDDEVERILALDFKKRLMEKLGLTSEPEVPEDMVIPPKEVIDDIAPIEDEETYEEDNGMMDTVFLQPLNNESTVSNTTFFFEYKIDADELKGYRVEQATLWLYMSANAGSYEVYEKFSTQPRRMVLIGKHGRNAVGWKKLTFKPNQQWLENAWRKLRIEIEGIAISTGHEPLLQLNIKHIKKRALKRSATTGTTTSDCAVPATGGKVLCCRHHKIIDLQKHLSWVVMPHTYRAFSCDGTCPIKHRNNNTWTFLMQIAAPSVRTPCCVPTGFSPITVIYVQSKKGKGKNRKNRKPISRVLHTKRISDMVVSSCGCL